MEISRSSTRLILSVLTVIVAACAHPRELMDVSPPTPPPEKPVVAGWASFYGPGLEGQPTASGEPFDPHALTAAHRHLPFGTCLRVVNLANGRSVRVRVNDRGPYVGARVIDLSAAAAGRLGMRRTGLAPVQAFLCHEPPPGGARRSRN